MPNHAVIAAYSPRTVGPSVRARRRPPRPAATVDATQAAIQKYQDIVAHGGWETVPAGPEQRVGSKGGAVEALRQRLVATGDLDPAETLLLACTFTDQKFAQRVPDRLRGAAVLRRHRGVGRKPVTGLVAADLDLASQLIGDLQVRRARIGEIRYWHNPKARSSGSPSKALG